MKAEQFYGLIGAMYTCTALIVMENAGIAVTLAVFFIVVGAFLEWANKK